LLLDEGGQRSDLHNMIVIRDSRAPISDGALRVRQYLDELQKKTETVICRPAGETLAALDALRRLLADAQAGDLTAGGRAIRPDDVQQWLQQNLPGPLAELRDELTGYPGLGRDLDQDDPGSLDPLLDLLDAEHLLPLGEAAKRLGRPVEQLQQAVLRANDTIGLLDGPPPVVFRIVAGAGDAQSDDP
jgi:hypothetical protein